MIRDLYTDAAAVAADLLAAPELAERWTEPSALAEFTVHGLAGHLATQIFVVPTLLAEPVPAEPVIGLHDYFGRAAWIGSDINDELSTLIRASGADAADAGPAALATASKAGVATLRDTLTAVDNRAVRRANWGPWSLTLDDFLASRLLEIVIHSDDLAHSVGLPTPGFAPDAVETVVDILSRVAIRRHGAVNVLRALSRAERAPASISAL
ncbi:maleylpyruvate isomerase N-terminal domain-containing protein [Actinokineospora sp. HUAS TT18]|uniref:maleylpyruvate isomerase N-terminal domain-containing protein n=1 Tax=Actinokineospora sp. HUAS TT18 TaxID=3447451 RepID=UPI003F51C922